MTKAVRWTEQELAAHRKNMDMRRRLDAAPVAADIQKRLVAKAPPKRSKYASQKVVKDGLTHDSKKEARRWAELQMLAADGQITDLRRQVAFELAPAVRLEGEKRMKPALRYWADFVYLQDGVQVVEDTKSPPTRKKEAYRIKKHLLATVHNIHIKEV